MALIQDPTTDGQLLVSCTKEADALEAEAEHLGVRVQRELDRLQQACKLYCICRTPYNQERPMLACDYCNDWFHYDCVGLRAPSEDEDDDDVAPKDYRCPHCTAKVRGISNGWFLRRLRLLATYQGTLARCSNIFVAV